MKLRMMLAAGALAALCAALPVQGATLPEERMLDAVNAFRADHDLAPVALSEALSEAATAHAEDLARRGLLDHVGADGADLGERLARVCYRYRTAAENLASGADTAAGAVVLWIGSPPHRSNLLLDEVDEIGVGRAREVLPDGQTRHYWVLDLARPRGGASGIAEGSADCSHQS